MINSFWRDADELLESLYLAEKLDSEQKEEALERYLESNKELKQMYRERDEARAHYYRRKKQVESDHYNRLRALRNRLRIEGVTDEVLAEVNQLMRDFKQ